MAIKKVFHLSDIHIRTYKMHKEYLEVFQQTLKDIKELSKGYNRDEVRVVISGDYVHQKITISNELLLLGTWFLRKLEAIAPVVVIAGNHDLLENNKDRLDSITPMVKLLPDLDIRYYVGDSACYLDDNVVWCVYSIFDENKRPDIESARVEHGNDKKYIGLFHAPVLGAKTDLGYEFDHGATMEDFEGCDMVMLGDIHLHQHWNHKGIIIAYAGSLIQQNIGENISGHGFLVWDIENKTFEPHEVNNDYKFYKFKITSIDDLDNNKEKLINA